MMEYVSAFVVVADQAIQEADAVAGTPRAIDLRLWRAHRGAGNIEMRPWRFANETLQKLSGSDGAAVTATDILHIRVLRIDQLVIGGIERHAPDALGGQETCRSDLRCQIVVIRE